MADRSEELFAKLSLEEKVSLVGGADLWHTRAIERLGIPALKLSDGPNGARGENLRGTGPSAACFPCGTALASSWDVSLVERIGAALGEEARTKGAQLLLAPTVNIHRSPLAGRNFECYSEDPHLGARVAVAFIRGVQSRGVGACVKHFVCNDSEFERMSISSEVAERPLREIYLPAFEAAVKEAGVRSVMSAYNRINGVYACEHPRLLQEILRDEWGFEGFVVSDWFGTRSTAAAANAGLDLEMPGPPRFMGEALLEALREGEVSEATLDDKVRRLLRFADWCGVFDQPAPGPERAVDRPEHRRLARESATQACVLLQNREGALPLDADALRKLVVVGPNADAAIIQAGGSSRVPPHYAVSPLDGIRARCGDAVRVDFERGCTAHRRIPALDARLLRGARAEKPGSRAVGFATELFASPDLSGEPVRSLVSDAIDFTWLGGFSRDLDIECFSARCTGTLEPRESGPHTFSLYSAGKSRLLVDGVELLDNWSDPKPGSSFYGAGAEEIRAELALEAGRAYDVEIQFSKQGPPGIAGLRAGLLEAQPADLLERAVAAAGEADAAIVVVGLDADWESEGQDRVDLELPGRQAELIRRVADASPKTIVVLNAGSPLRMEWLDRVSAVLQLWYPGQECGNALADVLFGDADPGGRLPLTFPRRLEDTPAYLDYPGENGQVHYGEGLFVGYRYYDRKQVEPLFPFGHGLSYAHFEYGELALSAAAIGPDDGVEASVAVTNTGTRAGREVVQLYVRDPECSLQRPEKELAAFAALALDPGETRTVRLALAARAFRFYDPSVSGWVAEPGEFELLVGRSSRDIRARAMLRLGGG